GLTAGPATRGGAAAFHGPDSHSTAGPPAGGPGGPPAHRVSSGCSLSSVHTWRRRADSAVSASAPRVNAVNTAHACHTGPRPPPVISLRSASTTWVIGRKGCSALKKPGLVCTG